MNLDILKSAKKPQVSESFTKPEEPVEHKPIIEQVFEDTANYEPKVVHEEPKMFESEIGQQTVQSNTITVGNKQNSVQDIIANTEIPEGMMLTGLDANKKPIFVPDPNYKPKPKIVRYGLDGTPVYEDDAPENNIKPLSLIDKQLSQEELKNHVATALGLPASNDIIVYDVPYANVQPKVLEITDTNGFLRDKIERAERKTGLSVVPLKVAGINNFVTSIQDYHVYALDGVKFASSLRHTVSKTRLDDLCEKIDEALMNGGSYNASIMMEYTDGDGERYVMPSLNKYEMGYVAALYRNYRAIFYDKDGSISIAVGI